MCKSVIWSVWVQYVTVVEVRAVLSATEMQPRESLWGKTEKRYVNERYPHSTVKNRTVQHCATISVIAELLLYQSLSEQVQFNVPLDTDHTYTILRSWTISAARTYLHMLYDIMIGHNSGSIKDGAMRCACSMGFSYMANWVVPPPSLLHDRKWPRITKCTYSLAVCNMVTFRKPDFGSSFSHTRCISREHWSSSYMKVIGSRSRSQEQKRSKMHISAI